MNIFLEKIKDFGKIYVDDNYKFEFKECSLNTNKNKAYIITGEKRNIITKTGTDGWTGAICKNELENSKEEYIWKIKILKSYNYNPIVGIATIDLDTNKRSFEENINCGWYYSAFNGFLYSGPPHNYNLKDIKLKSQKNEITIIMNMKKRSLKFIIENEDKGEAYTNIPLEKPIFPSVLLYYKNDSVEISEV